eukprot:scaffold21028_cov38-Prasinocladus_malaysianus.AAC.1
MDLSRRSHSRVECLLIIRLLLHWFSAHLDGRSGPGGRQRQGPPEGPPRLRAPQAVQHGGEPLRGPPQAALLPAGGGVRQGRVPGKCNHRWRPPPREEGRAHHPQQSGRPDHVQQEKGLWGEQKMTSTGLSTRQEELYRDDFVPPLFYISIYSAMYVLS